MNAAKLTHPPALFFLFFTEMWERFGFYVVQGLLILYTTEYFGYTDNEGYTLQGLFSGLVYISPFAGGYLADKFLGFKTSIVWGGLFLVLGYALLGMPFFPHTLFYPALAIIIVGNGLFKPNISSLLGAQYHTQDPKKDAGFTLFYIGINIGAFLAGMSSGYIKEYFGWHMSFGLSSIGLIIGLVAFFVGRHYIKEEQLGHLKQNITKPRLLFYCLLAILGLCLLFQADFLKDWLLPFAGITLLIFLSMLTVKQNLEFRKRLLVLNTLILSSIVFWALFLQLFFAANLYVDRLVDKNLFGLQLTTTIFYASESIFIILLGPLFAWLWHFLSDSQYNISSISKFILGISFAGFGFLVLSTSTYFPNEVGLISPLWIFFAYFLLTIGELLLSPIGLSAVTTLAPPHLVGMMMGIWFVATGFGGLFAGILAKMASVPETVQTTADKLSIYQHAFLNFAYLAFVIAIILYFLQFSIKKWAR